MLRKKLRLDEPSQSKNSKDELSSEYRNKQNINITAVEENISSKVIAIEAELKEKLDYWLSSSKIKNVNYIYQPLEYAVDVHNLFINRYCTNTKPILFLGMNPGPYGMCQTGVPFGEINATRNWLQISGKISKPSVECPERPILGFSCSKSEVSGKKFWALFEKLSKTPDRFFNSSFVYNYCPLAFMGKNGINITPDKIQANDPKRLEAICDEALLKIIKLLNVEYIIGLGRYSEKRALSVLKDQNDLNIQIHYLMHPSPMIPNNQNWPEKAEKKLEEINLLKYFVE